MYKEQANGSSHDSLWQAYICDFRIAYFQGDLDKAREILFSAYSDCEEYGELDFRLVASTHCLASSFLDYKQESDAVELFRRFVETREKVLGPDDPDVADSLEKVALMQIDKQHPMRRPAVV